MKNSLHSMIIRILGYFLKETGVLVRTFSFEGHGKVLLISTANILIKLQNPRKCARVYSESVCNIL